MPFHKNSIQRNESRVDTSLFNEKNPELSQKFAHLSILLPEGHLRYVTILRGPLLLPL